MVIHLYNTYLIPMYAPCTKIEGFKSRNGCILDMGLSSKQERKFDEAFENYPWNSLPLALERGAFELIDANEMEEGENILLRERIMKEKVERSLKITTEVLTYQLFSSTDDSKIVLSR